MGLETWKEEFYPVDAGDTHVDEALQHSIQKWTGLLPENLAKHGVVTEVGDVVDPQAGSKSEFWVDSDSCALCYHYLKVDDDYRDDCGGCPLFQELGCRCDRPGQPFEKWMLSNDPAPMLDALKRSVKLRVLG